MIDKISVNNEVITNIRKGEIDINNQDLFFSILIKGLLNNLDNKIKIRNKIVPHYIIHTGDDTMYLNMKGYDHNKEIVEISTDEIYSTIPRCMVNPGNIDLIPDQLSSPYSSGILQFEYDEKIYSLCGEFRRMPIRLSCDIKYYVDPYQDMLSLIQQIISKLSFIQTYNITYLGQLIKCSYKIPESFSDQHTMDIDGTTTDSKLKTLSLSLEIETTFPVWNEKTIVSNDMRINTISFGGKLNSSTNNGDGGENDDENNIQNGIKLYPPDGIKNNKNLYEIG